MSWISKWKNEGDYEYDSERFACLKDAMEYSGYVEDKEEMADEDCIIEE